MVRLLATHMVYFLVIYAEFDFVVDELDKNFREFNINKFIRAIFHYHWPNIHQLPVYQRHHV